MEDCEEEAELTFTFPKTAEPANVESVWEEISTTMKQMLFGKNQKEIKEEHSDRAIQLYSKKRIGINTKDLDSTHSTDQINDILLQGNSLDLSNMIFKEGQADFLCENKVNWCTIQRLVLRCDEREGDKKDANRFLKLLFTQNHSLRSLFYINIEHSNITLDTLKLWHLTQFNGDLIRQQDKISSFYGGVHIAELAISGVLSLSGFEEIPIKEKMEMQRPGEDRYFMVCAQEGFQFQTNCRLQIVFC